jgi:5-enolpyruvylshikimate-3-phosphate synthase
MNWIIQPAAQLHGVTSMPGDKSISHRALMHAALAQGTSRIQNFLHAGVTQAMMRCVRDLGVGLEWQPCESSETFARLPSVADHCARRRRI